VNAECYQGGWLIAVTPDDASELDGLMDAAGYKSLLGE